MRKLLNEYKEFISQGNVMAIAVALVMALYFKSIVDAVINGVIMPIVSAIVGEESFEDIGFGIGDTFISIGLVIQAVIMFLIVAFVLFLIVKAYNSYVAKPQEEGPSELDVLTEIRDKLRARWTRVCRHVSAPATGSPRTDLPYEEIPQRRSRRAIVGLR